MSVRIAYYISSHGYGHAARQQAVIQQLARRGAQVHVRTAAPPKFFQSAASYHQQRYDIGMKQRDALHFDIEASLRWYADFIDQQRDALIAQEVAFIRHTAIQLVVSDMPPIAMDIAAMAGVPAAVVTHFTWDWVYAHYTDDYPQYRYLVDAIGASYHKATLALQIQIPLPHAFDMFPHVEPVNLIYNQATRSREQIRAAFAIPDDHRVGLLSLGGHDWGDSNVRTLRAMAGWVFLTMPGAWEQVRDTPERFRLVPMAYDDYHNLIAHADLVVGKAGGSTVAEVIGHRTPMIYTTQHNWREIELLRATLTRYGVAHHVDLAAFMAGSWVEAIDRFMTQAHHWPAVARDGADQAAERLLALVSA